MQKATPLTADAVWVDNAGCDQGICPRIVLSQTDRVICRRSPSIRSAQHARRRLSGCTKAAIGALGWNSVCSLASDASALLHQTPFDATSIVTSRRSN